MDKIKEIKTLTNELEKYCVAYYKNDNPIISDTEYDALFDKLKGLEDETGFYLANSPTRKVKGYLLDNFLKVKHSKPMLSAKKSKIDEEIKEFIGDKECVMSYKLDGLTLVLRYNNGELIQAVTRGDGIFGEDVTQNAKMIKNIPLHIGLKDAIELRGEALITWETFADIQKALDIEGDESHPRNIAAGALRQHDTEITRSRNLEFYAHELVDVENAVFSTRVEEYEFLSSLGFDVVPYILYNPSNKNDIYEEKIQSFDIGFELPVDGIIIRYNDVKYSKNLGMTAHHPLDMIARKWEDKKYTTILRDIEWKTSKNGILYPTAIFDSVTIDGAKVSRATLHNINYIKNLKLGIGDTIKVSKRNMIIPAVEENVTESNNYIFPTVCPSCGTSLVEVISEDFNLCLSCPNDECSSKTVGLFKNFVARKALNIEGLSEAIVEKLIEKGYLKKFKDLYCLAQYKTEIINMEGFGERSYTKLIEAIENSKHTTLDRFICGLNIPLIGKSASKQLAEYVNWDISSFMTISTTSFMNDIEGFGDKMCQSLINYIENHKEDIWELAEEFDFIKPEKKEVKESIFTNKSFCITGSFEMGSREYLKSEIEALGGKFVSSVSKKTDILVAGEKCGSKLTKAKELNIIIIDELELKNILQK